jgi:hypothetical protein
MGERMMRTRMSNLLLAIGLVLMAAPVRAQPYGNSGVIQSLPGRPWVQGVSLGNRQRAYELFLEGNTIIKDGFFGQAADKYKAALELWDHPALHYNLGIAQMNLDQIIEAYHHFQAARHHGPRPIGEDKYEQAEVYLNLLGNQLAEIEVVCDEPGAEVALDGKPLFRAPGRQRIMVRPGGHRAEASKPGHLPDVRQAVLDPGDRERVRLAPQRPAQLATTRRWPQWIPWAVAGAGVVVLGGAAAMDGHATDLFQQFDRAYTTHCPGARGCPREEIPAELNAQLDNAHAWQRAAIITYVTGGVTVATSAALLYLNRERIVSERRSDDDIVSVSPMFLPEGGGISTIIRF